MKIYLVAMKEVEVPDEPDRDYSEVVTQLVSETFPDDNLDPYHLVVNGDEFLVETDKLLVLGSKDSKVLLAMVEEGLK